MKKIDIGKMICSIIGTIAGVVSLNFGSAVSKMGIGGSEDNLTYGADAYTGMQNAAAQAANNVRTLAGIVREGLSCLLTVLGLAMICYFVFKFLECFESNQPMVVVQQEEKVEYELPTL